MFAEMNANGDELPRVPPRHAVLLEQHRRTAASGRGTRSSRTRRRRRTRSTRTPAPARRARTSRRTAPRSRSSTPTCKDAVTAGFAQQSAKYNGTVPQENPLRYNARLGSGAAPPARAADAVRPGLHGGRAGDVLAGAPGRDGPRGADPLHRGRRGGVLEPGHPRLQRRRRPGLEHRREPVRVDGLARRSGDAGPASTRAAARRSSSRAACRAGGHDDARRRDRGRRHERHGRRRRRTSIAGQPFFVDTGLNLEVGQIASVGTAGATGTGVTLTAPLKLAHASGVPFHVNEGQPVGFTGDTVEHLNFFASGAPHGIGGEHSRRRSSSARSSCPRRTRRCS